MLLILLLYRYLARQHRPSKITTVRMVNPATSPLWLPPPLDSVVAVIVVDVVTVVAFVVDIVNVVVLIEVVVLLVMVVVSDKLYSRYTLTLLLLVLSQMAMPVSDLRPSSVLSIANS